MFIRWKSIEERLPLLFFGCVSGGIVARLLVSAQEREILLLCVRPGISHGSESEGRESPLLRLDVVCCVLELPHMLSKPEGAAAPNPQTDQGEGGRSAEL
ncbi:hypothetical protein QQF64_032196 [Cirrhinus molitorella]|uniref:Uncharacterized protein n=1 Tax=Cirrhinus molitorella TaxID=172907 RepID=A0ABR3MZ78_9TELE